MIEIDNENLNIKIERVVAARTYTALKNIKKVTSQESLELLGCSTDFFIEHIENLFLRGMNWHLHGLYGWHLDHIRPCASFDLTDPKQRKKCFHYTNMQPLWAIENIKKSSVHEGRRHGKKFFDSPVVNEKPDIKKPDQKPRKGIIVSTYYSFHELEIGESFFIRCSKHEHNRKRLNIAVHAQKFMKDNPNFYFSVLKVSGGVKCWRIDYEKRREWRRKINQTRK